jgi:two-component system, cell cycle sensor histidine kinase and response regulator CckA
MDEPTFRPVDIALLSPALFERAGDYVLVLEADLGGQFVIVDANAAALAAHGYSRSDVLGRPITLLDPFTPPPTADSLRALAAGEPQSLEVRHRRKDGSSFYVEARLCPLSFDARRLWVSVERDITDRKLAEERLRHQQRLMQYVISHARSAIDVHDRELRYVYVSDRYLKEYNVRERDVIGRHHYEVFPDLPQKWRDVHQRALRGEVCCAEEDAYERADGTLEWTRWECRPWLEADSTIGGIIVYTEVITDRVRAEEERRGLERQLHQARKMEAIGRLAGGVAHDFNNLLTSIIGNVSLLLMDLAPDDPQADALREIANAGHSAASLTRQLLAFSRKQIIEPKIVDLNDLVRHLSRMLQRLIGEDVTLTTSLAADLRSVHVDPGQFEQVLLNLSINARDAMPRGGQLRIETTNVDIDASYAQQHPGATTGACVRLSVTDTGSGMTADVKRHLFEPFFTTKTLGRGTGLGLATVFGIVKQSHGTVEVESEVGSGTTFRIDIPAITQPADPVPSRADTDEMPGGRETVLFVEDDETVRALGSRILRRLGYRVIDACDGQEAIEKLDQVGDRLDLLMTDVVMPGMNGRELADRVAARHPEAAILYASGYTEDVVVRHRILDAEVDFLHKPYTPQALARRVRDVLDATEKRRPC